MKKIVLFAAILFFVACDQKTVEKIGNGTEKVVKEIGDGTKKVVKEIGKGKDKLENKIYESALQKVVDEMNKEFPQSFGYGIKVDGLTLDVRYVNVNVLVTENKLLSVPDVTEKIKENRGQLILKLNEVLNMNDGKGFTNDLGIDGDFTDLKTVIVYLLKKTNREIAICARGTVNTQNVVVTTISPDEL